MNIEDNKRMACDFLQALSVHDPVRGGALLHEDLVYWTAGKKHLFPYAGERNREEFVAYLATPTVFTGGGSRMTPLVLTGEDDRVSMTAEAVGELADGRVYTNVYHYLFTFRDGKIVEVREYMDTQSAAEFFGF
jgi:ketosteroid isomerase-like protein